MIEALKPYPKYKDSSVPWLGDVPEHWDLKPNRSLLRPRRVCVGTNAAQFRLLSLTKSGVIVRDVESGKGKFSTDLSKFQVVRPGDFIFCLFDVPETPRTVGLSKVDGMITGAYDVLSCSDIGTAKFLEYLYLALDDRKLLSPLYSGLRNTIPLPRLLTTKSVVPPPDEKAAIVRFLEVADRRIQKYIRAKQRLIALLNEQKQAIIQRAVTQGLNPDAPKKPSGIPWLGDIPAHWEAKRAKYFYREVDERSKNGSEELLSVSHITGVTPRRLKNITMFMATSYAGHKLCRPGDLVINTMWAWMAALGVSEHIGIVSPSYAVYRPILPNEFHPRYIDALMRTRPYVAEYVCRSTGIRSSRLRLYPEKFLTLPIICPPREEQDKIVARFEEATTEMNRAIASAESEIRLLREYRTRLIADVVTGKLDVRAAAAVIPPETLLKEDLSQDSRVILDKEAESLEMEYA